MFRNTSCRIKHLLRSVARRIRPQRSVLFVRPDYHCSFFHRDELRRLGWKADVLVPRSYPQDFVYSSETALMPWGFTNTQSRTLRLFNSLIQDLWFLLIGSRYKYHIYYGPEPAWLTVWDNIHEPQSWHPSFSLTGFLGIRLVYVNSGCHDELTKGQFGKLDDGFVCNNCGKWDKCNDVENLRAFARIRTHFDSAIGHFIVESPNYPSTPLRWKVIDLDLWSPHIDIPEEFRLPAFQGLRILHSFSEGGRNYLGRNVKGSPFVAAAVQRLRQEGHKLEYLYLQDVPSRFMRFYQAQADIVVEQLIYGWFGSTGVETLSLGKPVVCYIRQEWRQRLLAAFPDYADVGVVEANTHTIYSVLKELVENPDLRSRYGTQARRFAEKHFDPRVNSAELADLLLSIE